MSRARSPQRLTSNAVELPSPIGLFTTLSLHVGPARQPEHPSLIGLFIARSLDVGLTRRLFFRLLLRLRLLLLLLLSRLGLAGVIDVVALLPQLLVDRRYDLEKLFVLVDRQRDSLRSLLSKATTHTTPRPATTYLLTGLQRTARFVVLADVDEKSLVKLGDVDASFGRQLDRVCISIRTEALLVITESLYRHTSQNGPSASVVLPLLSPLAFLDGLRVCSSAESSSSGVCARFFENFGIADVFL